MKSAKRTFIKLSLLISLILIVCLFLLKPFNMNVAISSFTLNPLNLHPPRETVIPERFIVYESSPEIIEPAFPHYPGEAMSKGIEGTVMLILTIDRTGSVSNAEIIEDVHPLLDTAAVHSVYSMKFRAAEMRGNPVKSYIRYPVTFLLE
ncbi:MAG: energy transducer TonB [bacterium]